MAKKSKAKKSTGKKVAKKTKKAKKTGAVFDPLGPGFRVLKKKTG